MPKTSVRAAVYLRVSLDPTGEELAVTRQREDCLAIAAARGWSVVEVYVDNSASATTTKRERVNYERMVADYKRGRFSALVCWDLDRLTRQPRQLEDWIDAAESRGLLLVTANGEADLTTDAGKLFARIKAAVARAEVERKGKRQSRAQRQRAERGLPPAGVRLTGYTLRGEVIPEEAAMVRDIFDRFVAGDSLRGLAQWLTESGKASRTDRPRWNPSTVRGILTNARYAGRSVYRGQDTNTAGQWEAIVSPEKFATAQTILSDPRRKTNHRGTDPRHLGSGLYRCGMCGAKVHGWTPTADGFPRYRCPVAHLTRAGRDIDALVTGAVAERLRRPDLLELLALPADSEELARLAADMEAARRRLVEIESDYDAGLIDGRRYAAASDKARAAVADVQRQQAALVAAAGPGSVLGAPDPAEAFLRAPLGVRQRIIDLFMVVNIDPAPRGRKTFDPLTIRIEWRQA